MVQRMRQQGMTRQEMNENVRRNRRQPPTPRGESKRTPDQLIQDYIREYWVKPLPWTDNKGFHISLGMGVLKPWEREKVARINLGL